jgi:uncharacterized RmlC-like cupin family protein
LHLLEIPAGVSSNPHYHEAHETAIFVLERAAEMLHAPNLEHLMRLYVEAADFTSIPAGVPHQPFNSTDAPGRAVGARTDPTNRKASSSSTSLRLFDSCTAVVVADQEQR